MSLLALAAYALVSPSTARGAESGFLSAAVTATHFFDPLQHNVVDVAGEFADGAAFQAHFLQNFNQTGGIERWGYPTSAVVEETPGNLSQYYQRGVVDWQPPPGGDHTFQRRLAWDYLGGGLGGSVDQGVELHLTNPNPGDLIGPWGHKVANASVEGDDIGFADFVHRLGGVVSFGFPKTDARQDDHSQAVLRTPGRPPDSRIRQYFQAAVLEYHPESPESPVKLSLLGDTLRDSRYPSRTWQQFLAFGPEAPLAVGDLLELGLESRRGPLGSTAEDVARFLEFSLLRVTTDLACGSGFFVTPSGYAVTTWNLVSDAGLITVESTRGFTAPAQLVAGDAVRNVALLKVPGQSHIPVAWGDSDSLALNTELVALGHDASRLDQARAVGCQPTPSAKTVVVSSPLRTQGQHFLPSLGAGNGGGPVALRSGRVVGMSTSALLGFPRADLLAPVAALRPLVDAWIEGVIRGETTSLPHRPRFDRIVMAEHDRLPCPGGGGVEVRGSKIELTTTVSLKPDRIPVGILRFRNAYDNVWQSHDQINFGPFSVDGPISMLSWTRDHMDDYTIIKSGWNTDIASGVPFHLRFAYDGGSVRLFINGKPVHQEIGLPYGEHIWLKLECFGSTGIPPMYYSDLRVVGMPLPQN